jgi:hypothetical protein
LVAALTGAKVPTDATQTIRASIVTRELSTKQIGFRVTFQRTVFDAQGVLLRTESLEEPSLYQEFFQKLSKAVFLEAQQL